MVTHFQIRGRTQGISDRKQPKMWENEKMATMSLAERRPPDSIYNAHSFTLPLICLLPESITHALARDTLFKSEQKKWLQTNCFQVLPRSVLGTVLGTKWS